MGRTRGTVYNAITSKEKIARINLENRMLVDDFLEYLTSVGRSESTRKNYRADLMIFFCWVLDELNNKLFTTITKREMARFQGYAMTVWGWSPNRLTTVKGAIQSLANYIENVLDDEYADFRSAKIKIESPPKVQVREKTVLSSFDVDQILTYFTNVRRYEEACLFALAAFSGRRKAELCRFKVSDFDPSHLVCDGALYKSDPIKTKGRGGGKYLNCYTLAKKFQPYLDAWLKYREENGIKSDWLFVAKDEPSRVLPMYAIDMWMSQASDIINKPVYAHAFRHAFTTYLLAAGIPDNAVQTIMGWSSADMLRIYDDRSSDEQITAYFKDGDIASNKKKNIGDL